MLEFLKRRWVLLSCVLVLLAFSMVDLLVVTVLGKFVQTRGIGISRGAIGVYNEARLFVSYEERLEVRAAVHGPRFGKSPLWEFLSTEYVVSIPLWLPLSTVLGWLVFLELRWREKQSTPLNTCSPE